MGVHLKVKGEGNLKSDGSGSWKGVGAGAGVGAGRELGRELGLDLSWSWAWIWGWSWGRGGGGGGREILHFTASDLQIRFLVQNGVWRLRPKLEWLLGLGFYTGFKNGKCHVCPWQPAIKTQFSIEDSH